MKLSYLPLAAQVALPDMSLLALVMPVCTDNMPDCCAALQHNSIAVPSRLRIWRRS